MHCMNLLMSSAVDIRHSLLDRWNKKLSERPAYTSDSLSGASPPSVFVGSYGYPKVLVGPMVPPNYGDTSLLDSPERWKDMSLDTIINLRLSLVRGTQKTHIDHTDSRYIQELQALSMSSKPIVTDLEFDKPIKPIVSLDDHSPVFGPMGQISRASFASASSQRSIERVFYDRDLAASDAVLNLYRADVEISRIQRCFSIGMFGKHRYLVPTRWSITATDSIISKSLADNILDHSFIDSYRIFNYAHLGNKFVVILFPHRWLYEMIEAWYSDGVLGFGSDYEDARGISHPPTIAGAYFAAKLGVLEYLHSIQRQAGVLILREISPEYALPVGVWQVREGIRSAMQQKPIIVDSFDAALYTATKMTSITSLEWLKHGHISDLLRQKTLSDFVV